jgi:hypothetical protein
MKILLTIPNPPEGMNSSQLFESDKHLNDWINENKSSSKISDSISVDKQKGKVKGNGEDWASHEEKEENFKNY